MAAEQVQTGVEDRRMRFGLITCGACGALVPEDCSCCNCAAIFDRQAVIDMLIGMKAMKAPEGPMAA